MQRAPRLQVLDPTERFQNATDLQNYVHNMFDLIYMLEYLEGQSIVNKLSVYQKMAALRKIENKYVKDPVDGNEVYATNVVKELTEAEANKLINFESLIDHNILSAREYQTGDYERNGYYTIKLFAPIYSALSSEKGTPGDLMGRRIAYELLAAKGFKELFSTVSLCTDDFDSLLLYEIFALNTSFIIFRLSNPASVAPL